MEDTLAPPPPLAPRGRSGVTALVAERVRHTRTPAAADSDAEDAALSQCPTRENSYGSKDPRRPLNPKPTEIPGPDDMADAILSTKSIRASSAGSRASSARAGFQALRRISCSSSNTNTLPSMGGGGGWKSLSLSIGSSFSERGSISRARARSDEPRRPMRRSSAEAAASAKPKPKPDEPAKPKPKSKRKAMIMPSASKPLRAGALLPSASAPGALASDAADAAWPEPLTSPCKPSSQVRGGWGGDGARGGAAAAGAAAAGTPAPAAAAACFSRGLLTRAQEQLSSGL